MEDNFYKALCNALLEVIEAQDTLDLSDYLKLNIKQHLLEASCTEWHGTIHADTEFVECDNCGGAYPLDDSCDCEDDDDDDDDDDDEWDYKQAIKV